MIMDSVVHESNKLIVWFSKEQEMGIVYLPQHGRYISNYGQIEYKDCFDLEELEYHYSWDWLMPIIYKIKHISKRDEFLCNSKEYQNIKDAIVSFNLEPTYFAVVDFIKMYKKRIGV